jgi:hypothetical protein
MPSLLLTLFRAAFIMIRVRLLGRKVQIAWPIGGVARSDKQIRCFMRTANFNLKKQNNGQVISFLQQLGWVFWPGDKLNIR